MTYEKEPQWGPSEVAPEVLAQWRKKAIARARWNNAIDFTMECVGVGFTILRDACAVIGAIVIGFVLLQLLNR